MTTAEHGLDKAILAVAQKDLVEASGKVLCAVPISSGDVESRCYRVQHRETGGINVVSMRWQSQDRLEDIVRAIDEAERQRFDKAPTPNREIVVLRLPKAAREPLMGLLKLVGGEIVT